jgi:hypothetical protein
MYPSDYKYSVANGIRSHAKHSAEVLVVNGDCLEVGLWLKKEKKVHPVVLDMVIIEYGIIIHFERHLLLNLAEAISAALARRKRISHGERTYSCA